MPVSCTSSSAGEPTSLLLPRLVLSTTYIASVLLRSPFQREIHEHIHLARLCYDASVHLSVTEVHWRIIANFGFKFRSQFTALCGRGACWCEGRDHRREEWRDYLALCQPLLGHLVTVCECYYTPLTLGGIKQRCGPSIRLSVCLSVSRPTVQSFQSYGYYRTLRRNSMLEVETTVSAWPCGSGRNGDQSAISERLSFRSHRDDTLFHFFRQ